MYIITNERVVGIFQYEWQGEKTMIKTTKLITFLMLGIIYAQTLIGCPTCIGRLELQSPAFFSDELYRLDPEDDVPSTLIRANGLGKLRRTSDANEVTNTNAAEDDEDD